MALGTFGAERFRCLASVELELDSSANVFVGPNASGKTSLLEAAFYLSRGRSFRSRRRDALIAGGEESFQVTGTMAAPAAPIRLGVRATRGGSEWRVGGEVAGSIAELAAQFPAQVIDPEVHKLLEEGPGRRRRYLDWGVFHVEHAFLGNWRRYQQALRQRNAALKQDAGDRDLVAWELELATTGEELARQRNTYLARIAGPLQSIGLALLDEAISLVHHPGWDADRPLLEALSGNRRRDRRYGATQLGPHRGDVVVQVGGGPAKDRVSRGQQKLVAAALMLAQLEVQEQESPGRSALLLDDPAAELDTANLSRLMAIVQAAPAQLWITALKPNVRDHLNHAKMFHVERGRFRPD